MSRNTIQTARDYAQRHPQNVRLCWVDRHISVCSALEAVALCAVPHVAACIVGAVAQDMPLENLLNRLIDGG